MDKTKYHNLARVATCLQEVRIDSNRPLTIWKSISSQALYTPPVTLRELIMFEVVTLITRKEMLKARLVTRVKS
ncbi:hypothetical protein CR513_14424, partial [Mucuna pruriens]